MEKGNKTRTICMNCLNSVITDRHEDDPQDARLIITYSCNNCAAEGNDVEYLDFNLRPLSAPKEEVKEIPGDSDLLDTIGGHTVDELIREQNKIMPSLSPEQSTPKIEVVDTPKLPDDDKNSWPLIDVLRKLVEVADILLHKKDYDGHGWEEMEHCYQRGKEIILQLENPKRAVTKEKESNGEELVEALNICKECDNPDWCKTFGCFESQDQPIKTK
jgi:hypothetical protein